jgi:hypothetical protein
MHELIDAAVKKKKKKEVIGVVDISKLLFN